MQTRSNGGGLQGDHRMEPNAGHLDVECDAIGQVQGEQALRAPTQPAHVQRCHPRRQRCRRTRTDLCPQRWPTSLALSSDSRQTGLRQPGRQQQHASARRTAGTPAVCLPWPWPITPRRPSRRSSFIARSVDTRGSGGASDRRGGLEPHRASTIDRAVRDSKSGPPSVTAERASSRAP